MDEINDGALLSVFWNGGVQLRVHAIRSRYIKYNKLQIMDEYILGYYMYSNPIVYNMYEYIWYIWLTSEGKCYYIV